MVFEELVRPDQPARYPTHPLAERCGNGPLRIAGLERGFMARNVVIRRYGDRCRIPRKLRRSAELSDHSHARCQWVQEIADRKSVVEGKSVSVGVDCGGSRIIQKKNSIISYNTHKNQ